MDNNNLPFNPTALDFSKLFIKIHPANAARLRNVLFDIFREEQTALLKMRAYVADIKLHTHVENLVKKELNKNEEQTYSKIAQLSYYFFVQKMQEFANAFNIIEHLPKKQEGTDGKPDSPKLD